MEGTEMTINSQSTMKSVGEVNRTVKKIIAFGIVTIMCLSAFGIVTPTSVKAVETINETNSTVVLDSYIIHGTLKDPLGISVTFAEIAVENLDTGDVITAYGEETYQVNLGDFENGIAYGQQVKIFLSNGICSDEQIFIIEEGATEKEMNFVLDPKPIEPSELIEPEFPEILLPPEEEPVPELEPENEESTLIADIKAPMLQWDGEKTSNVITLTNLGDRVTSPITAEIYLDGVLIDILHFGAVLSGKSKDRTVKWTPEEPGEYTMSVVIENIIIREEGFYVIRSDLPVLWWNNRTIDTPEEYEGYVIIAQEGLRINSELNLGNGTLVIDPERWGDLIIEHSPLNLLPNEELIMATNSGDPPITIWIKTDGALNAMDNNVIRANQQGNPYYFIVDDGELNLQDTEVKWMIGNTVDLTQPGGIQFNSQAKASITGNCVIHSSLTHGIYINGAGVNSVTGEPNVKIQNSQIIDNGFNLGVPTGGSGIYFTNDATGLVEGNTISGNDFAGVFVSGSNPTILNNNPITNQQYGIYMENSPGLTTTTTALWDGTTDVSEYTVEFDNSGIPITTPYLKMSKEAKIQSATMDLTGQGVLTGYGVDITQYTNDFTTGMGGVESSQVQVVGNDLVLDQYSVGDIVEQQQTIHDDFDWVDGTQPYHLQSFTPQSPLLSRIDIYVSIYMATDLPVLKITGNTNWWAPAIATPSSADIPSVGTQGWASFYFDTPVSLTVGTVYYILINGNTGLGYESGHTNTDLYPGGHRYKWIHNPFVLELLSYPDQDMAFITYTLDFNYFNAGYFIDHINMIDSISNVILDVDQTASATGLITTSISSDGSPGSYTVIQTGDLSSVDITALCGINDVWVRFDIETTDIQSTPLLHYYTITIESQGAPIYTFPTDPQLDVGNDGDFEWEWTTGVFDTTATTPNFAQELQNHINLLPADVNGNVLVPLGFSSQTTGKIFINNVDIVWKSPVYITGNNIDTNDQDGIHVETSENIKIEANKITNNNKGIYSTNSQCQIISNEPTTPLMEGIYSNSYGIYFDHDSRSFVRDNEIRDNSLDGIYLESSTGTIILSNDIHDNQQNGIYLRLSSPRIEDNHIYNHLTTNYAGIRAYWSSGFTITNNNPIENNYMGLYMSDGCGWGTVSGNTIQLSTQVEILAHKCIYTTIEGNTITGIPGQTLVGILVMFGHDSTISSNAISNVKEGISFANSYNNMVYGNTVFNTDKGITFGGSLTYSNIISQNNYLYDNQIGIDIGPSAYSNTIGPDNYVYSNAIGVNININAGQNTIIGNFIYENEIGINAIGNTANTLISDTDIYLNTEWGIYSDSSTLTIVDNTIYDNYQGIYYANTASGAITNNQIYGHVSAVYQKGPGGYLYGHLEGYGIYLQSASIPILGNTLTDNRYGIYVLGGSPQIGGSPGEENIISDNLYRYPWGTAPHPAVEVSLGWGIFVDGSTNIQILNNQIFSNSRGIEIGDSTGTINGNDIYVSLSAPEIYPRYYGIAYFASSLTISNNPIISGYGIGIYGENSGTGTSISGPTHIIGGTGISLEEASPTIENVEIDGNGIAEIGIYISGVNSNPTIKGCAIHDNLYYGIIVTDAGAIIGDVANPNDIYNNYYGINARGSTVVIEGNTIHNNDYGVYMYVDGRDQIQYSSEHLIGPVDQTHTVGQTFTRLESTLLKVNVYITKNNVDPLSTITLHVKDDIASSDIVSTTLTADKVVTGWNTFQFPSEVDLSSYSPTDYILLTSDTATGDYQVHGLQAVDDYGGGRAYVDGIEQQLDDVAFETYVKSTISDNAIQSNTQDGILTEYASPEITGNTIDGNGGWGIHSKYAPIYGSTPTVGINGLGKILQEWWLKANILDETSTPVQGIGVEIIDSFGTNVATGTTWSDGWARWPGYDVSSGADVAEYLVQNDDTWVNYNDYNVLAIEDHGEYAFWNKEDVTMDWNKEVVISVDFTLRTFDIQLLPFQDNYISLPLIDTTIVMASDLYSVIEANGIQLDYIKMYDPYASPQQWKMYWDGATDFTLNRDYAYIVKTTGSSSGTFTLTGYLPAERNVELKNLNNYIGWICYDTPIWASDLANLVGGDFIKVGYWDGAGWQYYDPTDPVPYDFQLIGGKAYNVQVSADTYLNYAEYYLAP